MKHETINLVELHDRMRSIPGAPVWTEEAFCGLNKATFTWKNDQDVFPSSGFLYYNTKDTSGEAATAHVLLTEDQAITFYELLQLVKSYLSDIELLDTMIRKSRSKHRN